jgi:hypothetical protein
LIYPCAADLQGGTQTQIGLQAHWNLSSPQIHRIISATLARCIGRRQRRRAAALASAHGYILALSEQQAN